MCNRFVKSGKEYRLLGNSEATELKKGIYKLCFNQDSGFWLEKKCDKFILPKKIYDIQNNVIERSLETYKRLGKLGCAFCGIKGTGKTVTAKIIANRSELPVIIVSNCVCAEAITNYLSKFDFPHVLFFDEFEKEFNNDKGEQDAILSFLDGTNENGALALITSNSNSKINENMIGRPSRIRYFINYDSLSMQAINEIIEDCLKVKKSTKEKAIKDIKAYVKCLKFVTIDVLKSLIDEYNVYGDLELINVDKCKYKYYIGNIYNENLYNFVLDNIEKFTNFNSKEEIFSLLGKLYAKLSKLDNNGNKEEALKILNNDDFINSFVNIDKIYKYQEYNYADYYDRYARRIIIKNSGINVEDAEPGDEILDADSSYHYATLIKKISNNISILSTDGGNVISIFEAPYSSNNLAYSNLI